MPSLPRNIVVRPTTQKQSFEANLQANPVYRAAVSAGLTDIAIRAILSGRVYMGPAGPVLAAVSSLSWRQRLEAALFTLVFADILLRKSPLAMAGDLIKLTSAGMAATKMVPALMMALNVKPLDDFRQAMYRSQLAQGNPRLLRLMELAGWSGDASKEYPSAKYMLLKTMTDDINRLVGRDPSVIHTM